MPKRSGSGTSTTTPKPVNATQGFIDRGRPMAEGPPLLKERRYLPQDAAEQLWRSLQSQGWTPLPKPAWSASADV